MTAAALLERLQGVQSRGELWLATCPAHAPTDNNPSLAIGERSGEWVQMYCRAGCGAADVLAAVGLSAEALCPEVLGSPQSPDLASLAKLRSLVSDAPQGASDGGCGREVLP